MKGLPKVPKVSKHVQNCMHVLHYTHVLAKKHKETLSSKGPCHRTSINYFKGECLKKTPEQTKEALPADSLSTHIATPHVHRTPTRSTARTGVISSAARCSSRRRSWASSATRSSARARRSFSWRGDQVLTRQTWDQHPSPKPATNST